MSLPLGLALQLVVVATVLHLELVKLALGPVAVATTLLLLALLLGLLAGNAKLILAQFLQVLQQRRCLLEQAEQLALRIGHDLDILGQFLVGGLAALDIPRGADDVLLRIEQVGDGLLLLAPLFTSFALLLLLAHTLGGGSVLAEDFLERPHRGEE